MGWGRIDDGFDDHPKVLAILDEDDPMEAGLAIGLWSLGFSWANRNTRKRGKVPGLLPAGLPRRYFGAVGKVGAAMLVKHGLWDVAEQGGWIIHDFDDYLPTAETRAARSAAGKRGAEKRWGRKREEPCTEDSQPNITNDGNEPSPDSKLPSPDSNEPPVSHGAATGPIANDGSRAPARRAISKEIAPTPTPTPTPEVHPPPAGADKPRDSPLRDLFGGKRTPTDADIDAHPDFAAFWDAYPRKKDKGHARKAWLKAVRKGVDPKLIVKAAEAFRDDPYRNPQFTAHPATWLNGERWDDDLTPAPTGQNDQGWGPFHDPEDLTVYDQDL